MLVEIVKNVKAPSRRPMTSPLIETVIVMYITAIGVLWAATRILAPNVFEFSIARGLGAAFLMTLFGNAARIFLNPLIGDWYVLVALLMYVLVVRGAFRLAFWRSAIVALIYIIIVAAVFYFVFARNSTPVSNSDTSPQVAAFTFGGSCSSLLCL